MKVFTHFSFVGFSNSYLVGPAKGGDAIMIDPGTLGIPLLRLIEENGFLIRHILLTHNHTSHTRGATTLLKIYPATIYGKEANLLDQHSEQLKDGEIRDLSGIEVESIEIPGHSGDSLVYRIGSCFFSGDVLYAGGIGSTKNRGTRTQLVQSIKNRLLCYDRGIVYPGHGPPSTLDAERKYNPFLRPSSDIPIP